MVDLDHVVDVEVDESLGPGAVCGPVLVPVDRGRAGEMEGVPGRPVDEEQEARGFKARFPRVMYIELPV